MKAPTWILSIFPVLLLAACQGTLITDLVTRPGDTIFEDDFSDPSSGWTRSLSQAGIADYDQGAYRILVLAAQYDLWSVPGKAFQDTRVEVDASRVEGPVQNRYGVICGFQGPRNFTFFIISSDGYYAIGGVRNGERRLIGQEMMAYSPAIVPGNGTNHLRLDCVGRTLTAYVNGQAVAATQDDESVAGDVGLLAGTFSAPGVDVAFHHFVVIRP
jgi:hypothetical protein